MRSIVTNNDIRESTITFQSAEPINLKPDGYVDKIIKYIPSETVAAYIIIQKTIEQFQDKIPFIVSWIIILIMFFGNIFYLKNTQKVKRWSQIFVNSIAFIIWVYALGEPFKHLLKDNYQPAYSVIGIILFSFIVPLFEFEKI